MPLTLFQPGRSGRDCAGVRDNSPMSGPAGTHASADPNGASDFAGGEAVALLLTISRYHGASRGDVQPLTWFPGDSVALASLVFGKDVEPKCGLTHGA